jgi:hypothetical protein
MVVALSRFKTPIWAAVEPPGSFERGTARGEEAQGL